LINLRLREQITVQYDVYLREAQEVYKIQVVQPEVENLKVPTPTKTAMYYICMMSIKQEVVTLAKSQKLMKRFQWLSLAVRCIFVL